MAVDSAKLALSSLCSDDECSASIFSLPTRGRDVRPLTTEWRRLLARLSRLTGDAYSAEDALQDAYIRMAEYRLHHIVREPERLFVRIAVNFALNGRRRALRQNWAALPDGDTEIADKSPLQDEVLASRERLRLAEAVLAQMPQRTKDAFLMHRLEGLKYREIAELLNISVSAVEKHIARANLLLTEAVERLESDL